MKIVQEVLKRNLRPKRLRGSAMEGKCVEFITPFTIRNEEFICQITLSPAVKKRINHYHCDKEEDEADHQKDLDKLATWPIKCSKAKFKCGKEYHHQHHKRDNPQQQALSCRRDLSCFLH